MFQNLNGFDLFYILFLAQLNTAVLHLTVTDSTEIKLPNIEGTKRIPISESPNDFHIIIVPTPYAIIDMYPKYTSNDWFALMVFGNQGEKTQLSRGQETKPSSSKDFLKA